MSLAWREARDCTWESCSERERERERERDGESEGVRERAGCCQLHA